MSWLIRMLLKPGDKRHRQWYEAEISDGIAADEMMQRN